MRKSSPPLMSFAAFAIFCLTAVPLWASWNNVTDSSLITGSRVTVAGKDGKQAFVELRPGKPTVLDMQKKGSTRWKITTDGRGTLTVSKDGSPVQTKALAKGDNDIKIFLEAGKYQVNTTIGARAHCFLWKKPKLSSLVPDGGGFATYMQAGDQKFAYYRANKDTVPVLSVKGPTTAYIYFRADLPKGSTKTSVDVSVRENDSAVDHKIAELMKSEKAEASEDSTMAITEALVIKVAVPEGVHKYSVHADRRSGYVKFYKADKNKKGLASGSSSPGESLNETDLDEDLAEAGPGDEDEIAKDASGPEPRFRLAVRTGAYYDNNVYRYSPGYLDTFNLNLKTYRYPGVKKLSDRILPLETRASARLGRFTAAATVSLDAYLSNPKLTNMGYNLSLAWSGPVKLRAAYRLTPYDPVRPTFYAPRSYEMMKYSENKGTLSAQWNRWELKPGADFSFGYYDYNATFDMYDAPFWETGLTLSRTRPLGFRVDCEIGNISARKNSGQDWSNLYLGAGADAHVPIRSFLLGVKGAITSRDYATKDPLDTHYRRKDLSGDGFGYVKYEWSPFAVTARAGYLWRATTSPLLVIDEEKDYRAITGGMEFSWEISV